LALAGDDGSACQVAAELLDRLGFDPVLAGPLEHGHVLDPQGNVFGKLTDQRSLSDLIHQERSQVSAA
jgi:predicted dinucleotide-binding enzyme